MPITLGLNLSSIKAQSQLARSSSQLSSVFERLSSGQRINRASDDAAGLAIAESLNSDARVFAQGIRNLNDGLSVLNVADGAISTLSDIVVRLQELAEQSANGVYSVSQRKALDKEAQTLSDEYARIIRSTEFNGRNILEGDYGELALQAGYGDSAILSSGLGGNVADGTYDLGDFLTNTYDFTNSGVFEAELGDFTGDGHIDLARLDRNNDQIVISVGDGQGSFDGDFISSGSISIDLAAGIKRGIVAEDFDNDGNLDFAVTDSTSGTVELILGNGNGTFESGVTYQSGTNFFTITSGDINNDGNQDIITGQSNEISILLGNGDGTFQTESTISAGSNARRVVLEDVDNDGILDAVVARFGGINVLRGNGDGSFQSAIALNITNASGNFDLGDINGDGNLDLVTTTTGVSETFVQFLGNGDGTFQASTSFSLGSGTGTEEILIEDFNDDGNLDVLRSDSFTNSNIYFGNGDGTYGTSQEIDNGSSGREALFGDVNEDGVADLLFVGSGFRVHTAGTNSGVATLLDFDLSTLVGAKQALTQFAQKIDQLSEQRGQIGAFQARIDVAENVLQVTTENYRAAESRIRDADIAQEAADLVRLQILQQAGASVLGQANLQPQLVLQLLGGGR